MLTAESGGLPDRCTGGAGVFMSAAAGVAASRYLPERLHNGHAEIGRCNWSRSLMDIWVDMLEA